MLSYTIANVLLHVVLISSFIAIFFFTYGSKVEGHIVQNQCKMIVDDLMSELTAVIPDDVLESTNNAIATRLQAPDMTVQDEKVKQSNKLLIDKTIKLMIGFFLIGIIIVVSMSFVFKFPLKDLLIHNAITLAFVALTEFGFLTYFAQNYITIDSNYIKFKSLETINKKL